MRVGCRVVLQEALMKTMLLDCVAPLTVVYRSVTTRTSKYIEGGRTALHYVASKGWVEVAEILLSKGAKVNSKDKEITETGGKTVWGEPSAIGTALEGLTFDVFLDNNGKDFDTVKPVVDWAKSSGAGPFLFISSAVIYKQTEDPPHVEGDTVKADAGHVAVRSIFLRFSETGQAFAHNT